MRQLKRDGSTLGACQIKPAAASALCMDAAANCNSFKTTPSNTLCLLGFRHASQNKTANGGHDLPDTTGLDISLKEGEPLNKPSSLL